MGVVGSTRSTKWAAEPAIRRPAQLGQRPRTLHEKATARSSPHVVHCTWTPRNPRTPGISETRPRRTSAEAPRRLRVHAARSLASAPSPARTAPSPGDAAGGKGWRAATRPSHRAPHANTCAPAIADGDGRDPMSRTAPAWPRPPRVRGVSCPFARPWTDRASGRCPTTARSDLILDTCGAKNATYSGTHGAVVGEATT